MGLLFLLLSGWPQDLDALLEALRSADVEVRSRAEEELVVRGGAAVAALKRFEADPDIEVRERATRAIEEISRRERVRSVRPIPPRLTLRLADEPLPSALGKVFPPLGHKVMDSPTGFDRVKNRRVSLDLKDAGLWEAVRAVETSAKIRIEFTSWGVEALNPGSEGPTPVVDAGGVRLSLHLSKRPTEIEVRLVAFLPSGSAPLGWSVEELKLVDEEGRTPDTRPDPFPRVRLGAPLRKRMDELVSGEVWRAWIKGGAPQSIRLQGKFVTSYPRDVVKHAFEMNGEDPKVVRVIDGIQCTLSIRRFKDGEAFSHEESFVTQAPGPKRRYLLWAEDARGRPFADLTGLVLGGPGGGSMGGGGGPHGDGKTKLAALVLAELVGEERVVVPFDFKDVPLPR
jgi:hypothetical protein